MKPIHAISIHMKPTFSPPSSSWQTINNAIDTTRPTSAENPITSNLMAE